jgi:hypothetical protein
LEAGHAGTGRHTRLIVVAALAIAVVSTPFYAQQEYSPQEIWSLRARAERGDAYAQYMLGAACFRGKGVPQDRAEAVRWYRYEVSVYPKDTR